MKNLFPLKRWLSEYVNWVSFKNNNTLHLSYRPNQEHYLGVTVTLLPLLARRSSCSTIFCWLPGKSIANSVSIPALARRRGLMCFTLMTSWSLCTASSSAFPVSGTTIQGKVKHYTVHSSKSSKHFALDVAVWNMKPKVQDSIVIFFRKRFKWKSYCLQ